MADNTTDWADETWEDDVPVDATGSPVKTAELLTENASVGAETTAKVDAPVREESAEEVAAEEAATSLPSRAKRNKGKKAAEASTDADSDKKGFKLKSPLVLGGAVIVVAAIVVAVLYFMGIGPFSGPVAARVNGDVITVKDLDARIESLKVQNPGMFDTEQGGISEADARKGVLDSMIDNLLLEQEAAREGITITDAQVQEQVDMRADTYQDRNAFEEDLLANGYTLEFFTSQIRTGLIIEALMDKKVSEDSITDEDIQNYYDSNQFSYTDTDGNVRSLDEVKESIRTIVLTQKRSVERAGLIQSLRDKATIKIVDPQLS